MEKKQQPEASKDQVKPLAIVLNGRLQQVRNASPEVRQWLKKKGKKFRETVRKSQSNKSQSKKEPLRLTMHLRRGDVAEKDTKNGKCLDRYKDRYGIDVYIEKLWTVVNAIHKGAYSDMLLEPSTKTIDCEIFTEFNFSQLEELLLKSTFKHYFTFSRIHRGTSHTMLNDLTLMATSDLFLASGSTFSTLAAYFLPANSTMVLTCAEPICSGYINKDILDVEHTYRAYGDEKHCYKSEKKRKDKENRFDWYVEEAEKENERIGMGVKKLVENGYWKDRRFESIEDLRGLDISKSESSEEL